MMENKCGSYFDGLMAGFLCCRKPHTNGRHMWYIKGQGNRCKFYWTDQLNSFAKLMENAKAKAKR